jgi:YARHG domain
MVFKINFYAAVFAFLSFAACKSKTAQNKLDADVVDTAATTTEKIVMIVADDLKEIIGAYVGDFGDNKINFLITAIKGDSIMGRSVVGGNDRPFKGLITRANNTFNFVVAEPGDNQYDGTFEGMISNTGKVTGTFTPNDKTRPAKVYNLTERTFVYDANAGNFPQASTRLLKESDVENLDKWDLSLMRNEIFARHGYCFQRKDTRGIFEVYDWYIPVTTDVKDKLTEVEKKNITLIKRYEKYAEDFSDDYGR